MGIKQNYINSILNNEVKDKKGNIVPLQKEQIKTLKKYDREIKLSGKMKTSTRSNSLCYLRSFGLCVNKPFEKVTKGDIEDFIEKQMDEKSVCSVNRWKGILKQFYKWLNGGEYPDSVEWIQFSNGKKKLAPSDLITREEIKEMIEKCDNPRDKCIIITLYETGARASELMSVNVEDVVFDEYGSKVFLRESKTKVREIRCIDSTPFIRDWLNYHPFKKDDKAPFFINLSYNKYGSRLTSISLGHLVKLISKRSGIKKNVYPHLFRHSRLTELLRSGFNETELKKFAGWTENSNMISTYVHLATKDIDDKLLKINGIKTEEQTKKVNVLKKKNCPFCDYENNPSNIICSNCSRPMEIREAVKVIKEREKYDKFIDLIIGDKVITDRIKEIKNKKSE